MGRCRSARYRPASTRTSGQTFDLCCIPASSNVRGDGGRGLSFLRMPEPARELVAAQLEVQRGAPLSERSRPTFTPCVACLARVALLPVRQRPRTEDSVAYSYEPMSVSSPSPPWLASAEYIDRTIKTKVQTPLPFSYDTATPSARPTPNVNAAATRPISICRTAEKPALRPLKSEVNTPIAASASTLQPMH